MTAAPLCVIYVRISFADVRRARAMSRQDPAGLDRVRVTGAAPPGQPRLAGL
jgi:hypothetical protein